MQLESAVVPFSKSYVKYPSHAFNNIFCVPFYIKLDQVAFLRFLQFMHVVIFLKDVLVLTTSKIGIYQF